MTKDTILYKLFNALNDTEELPIQDLEIDVENDAVNVCLADGTRFSVRVEKCGKWCLYKV